MSRHFWQLLRKCYLLWILFIMDRNGVFSQELLTALLQEEFLASIFASAC